MESVNEIKQALSARSRTATLDELRSEGKKRVRLIRAEHVAAMISEAVHSAVEQSGLVAPGEVEKLVEKSRQEFRSILKEREQEVQRAQETEQELADLKTEAEKLERELAAAKQELAAARGGASAGAAPAAPAAAGAPSSELLMSLMNEMVNMKASMLRQAPGQAAAAAGPAADFSAAMEKLAGSLTDRIEKIGKKMGVSAAVESDAPIDLGGLFKDTGKELESNMGNIEVKQKAGGGIAANLAKLKKLKGG
jgi:DNA mismatch repair ATPase MutL